MRQSKRVPTARIAYLVAVALFVLGAPFSLLKPYLALVSPSLPMLDRAVVVILLAFAVMMAYRQSLIMSGRYAARGK